MTRAALIDEVLPRGGVRLRHAVLFRVPADEAFGTALGLHALRHRLVRAGSPPGPCPSEPGVGGAASRRLIAPRGEFGSSMRSARA